MGTIQVLVMLVTALLSMDKPLSADCEQKFCLTNCTNDKKTCTERDMECVSLNCTNEKTTLKMICFKSYTLSNIDQGYESIIENTCTKIQEIKKCTCSPLEKWTAKINNFQVCSICVSPSTEITTSDTMTSSNPAVNASHSASTKNDLVNNISVGLAVGISFLSVFACLGLFALGTLLWRRRRDSKSASSVQTMCNTTSVDSNELGLSWSASSQRQNGYDQIVIDDFQNHSYTPLSLISNHTSVTESQTANQTEESNTCNGKSLLNIRSQDYTKLGEVTRDITTDYDQLPSNNITSQNDDLDAPENGEATDEYVGEGEKTMKNSVYFELEKSDEHKEDDFSKLNDTMMLMSSPKPLSVVSNISKRNTGVESNLEMSMDIIALNPSSQQVHCDTSTYFELEKQGEGDDDNITNTNSMTPEDHYYKLREVSRDISSDYNKLSTLDKTSENENALSSYTVAPETIPSSSNYSLAQIPTTTLDNDTTTVLLSTVRTLQ